MIKACIFDMDGTTVDSIKSIAHYTNETLTKFGYKTIALDRFYNMVGNGAKNLIERALKEVGANFSNFEEIFLNYKTAYNNNPCHLSHSYDGIDQMLAELKNAGIKLGILSNKTDATVQKINKKVFGDLIDDCKGDTETAPLKPNPATLLEMIDRLNAKKDEVLYIGDTDVDIFTAKNAGVKSIGVLWGFRDRKELEDAGADYIVKVPSEITEIALKKFQNN